MANERTKQKEYKHSTINIDYKMDILRRLLFLTFLIPICVACETTNPPIDDKETPQDSTVIAKVTLRDKINDIKNGNDKAVLVCAHRANTNKGINRGTPENSLAAIQRCIDDGIDMVELDIRTTKDGVPVLMHDAGISRTTNGTGNVKDKTLEQLKQLYLKDASGNLTTEKIPTLEEVFELGKDKITYNLDLANKNNPPRAVIKEVVNAGLIDYTLFFLSSDMESASTYVSFNENIMLHLTASSEAKIESYISASNLSALIPVVSISTADATNTNFGNLLSVGEKLPYTNALWVEDPKMKAGNYSGIDLFIQNKVRIIATDYGDILLPYLKDKKHR